MTTGGDGVGGFLRRFRLPWIAALVLALALAETIPVKAQLFGDQPPPVPPAAVPGLGPAMNLAPATGPDSAPSLPPRLAQPTLAQPSITSVPKAPAPPGIAPGQAVLSLSARYGKDLPVVNAGLVWRIFAGRADAAGAFKMIREERNATPNVVLPPGRYVVDVTLGLVNAVRAVTLKAEPERESFILPAGGLRLEGRVGTSRIPQKQISFAIYPGSQFDTSERAAAAIVPNVAPGDVVLLPEGIYHIVSSYGDANSVVRSDIRLQAGKLTDVTVTHRAAVITLKLASKEGGEALANTAWSVITPAGDVVKNSMGAFPRIVLAEGEYRVIAKNEGKVYERSFKVVNGVDGEVEVVAH
ncbi:MAG: hypothetical protein ACREDC_02405 [Bradyrhizobium sp.]